MTGMQICAYLDFRLCQAPACILPMLSASRKRRPYGASHSLFAVFTALRCFALFLFVGRPLADRRCMTGMQILCLSRLSALSGSRLHPPHALGQPQAAALRCFALPFRRLHGPTVLCSFPLRRASACGSPVHEGMQILCLSRLSALSGSRLHPPHAHGQPQAAALRCFALPFRRLHGPTVLRSFPLRRASACGSPVHDGDADLRLSGLPTLPGSRLHHPHAHGQPTSGGPTVLRASSSRRPYGASRIVTVSSFITAFHRWHLDSRQDFPYPPSTILREAARRHPTGE